MIGFLGQVALSNLLFASVLAGLAYLVHRSGRHPGLAHGLWVVVLVKAITPPLLLMPILPGSTDAPAASPFGQASGSATTGAAIGTVQGLDPMAWLIADGAGAVVLVWAVGSAVVAMASIVRIRRFDRLLERTSSSPPTDVVRVATEIAAIIGLRSVPDIALSSARVSPMTWWMGRRVRIVIPTALAVGVDRDQLRWVLAHELAHVRRHDHLVRWLEWVARVIAWWNPVVWWAQGHLREAEELSCDALVLERLRDEPRSYARALLAVVEFLAQPTTPQPVLATGMGAGATLERRFRRIVTDADVRSSPTWLRTSLSVATLIVLTLGIGAANPIGIASSPLSRAQALGAWSADPEAGDESLSFVSSMLGGPVTSAGRRQDGNRSRTRTVGQRLIGTSGPDTNAGGRGRDLIAGRAGADELLGGRGSDVIRGGPGRDTIDAGRGDDLVVTWQDGVADEVDCGAGDADRAIADPTDVVVECEVIDRRAPAIRSATPPRGIATDRSERL